MATKIVDLSGRGGLAAVPFREVDSLLPKPQNIVDIEEGKLAYGIFNPWLKQGYLAPGSSTTTEITKPGPTDLLSATVYDAVSGITYFAGGNEIYTLSTENDNSLSLYKTLDSGLKIQDLEIYSIYGGRALFYTYHDETNADKAVLFGADTLKSEGGIDIYSIPASGTLYAYSISSSFNDQLAQPFQFSSTILENLDPVDITGVRLKLRRSTGTHTWTLRVSIYDTALDTYYKPNSPLVTTTIDPNIVSTDTFEDVFIEFDSALTLTPGAYAVVLEPTDISELGAGEEMLWLASEVTSSDTSALASVDNGGSWDIAKAGGGAKFDLSVFAYSITNLVEHEVSQTVPSNDAPASWVSGTSTYEATATTTHTSSIDVTSNANNIVFAFITIQGTSDLVSGVTIGGDAMTFLDKSQNSHASYLYVYYKTGVTSGTKSIVATTGSTVRSLTMSRVAYNVSSTIYSTTKDAGPNELNGGDPGVDDPTVVTAPANSLAVQFLGTEWLNSSDSSYKRIVVGPYNAGALIVNENETPTLTTESGADPGGRPSILRTWNQLSSSSTLRASWSSTRDDEGDYDGANYSSFQIVLSGLSSSSDYTVPGLTGESSGRTFMRTADNNFLYLFSDNFVSIYDGEITGGPTGSLLKKAVLFHESVNVTDALDFRSRFYICVSRYPVNDDVTTLDTFTGQSYVYVWDRVSASLKTQDSIELPGVREIKKIYAGTDGALRLITINDAGLVELRRFGYNDAGGVVFPVYNKLGIGSAPLGPDGLTRGAENVYWIGSNGYLYSERDNAVSILLDYGSGGSTSAGVATIRNPGAIAYMSENATGTYPTGIRSDIPSLVFSYSQGGGSSERRVYPMSTYPIGTGTVTALDMATGGVYTGVILLPVTSLVRRVRIYNKPISGTGTDTVATINLYFNQSTTVGMTKTITKSEAMRGYVDFAIHKPYVQAVQAQISWPVGLFSTDTYYPNVMVIEHDDPEAKSPDSE